MIKPLLLFQSLLFFVPGVQAQFFSISGKVTNSSLEPLSYVSISIKDLKIGTTTDAQGRYHLQLTEGRYELVFTMIGYRQRVLEMVVRNKDVQQNLILEPADNSLEEVEIKATRKDRAEEIIRQVIRNKNQVQAASFNRSVSLYIRATQEKDAVTKIKKKSLPDTANADLKRMSMAEISMKLDYQYPDRMKEERTGVRIRGNAESLFYLSATEGDFNFYKNLVRVPALSTMPFLSPLSYSGLVGYRFKTISTRKENNQKIYTIRVTPVKLGNALVQGEVEVLDSTWVLLKTHFEFPKFHMPEYDFFSIDQHYELIDNKAWVLSRQEFVYSAKAGKTRMNGRTVAQFRDYDLQPHFAPGYFGNEMSATTKQAYDRDSSFWNQARTEPLTEKEIRFVRFKDSVFNAQNTRQYLDSIDGVYNRITWKKLLFLGQGNYDRGRERTLMIAPVASMYEPVGFGGHRIALSGNYLRTFPTKRNLSVWALASYGLRNRDMKGNVSVTRMYNPFNRGYYAINAGREFGTIFAGDAWINQLKRSNIFEHDNVSISHGLELFNGFFLVNELQFAMRRSVEDYRTNDKWDSLVDDVLLDNEAIAFQDYHSFYNSITLKYTPKQRYIREPLEKIILGSSWPTFYVTWRKGIPGIFKSAVNFDYLEFGLQQQLKLGLAGISDYSIFSGSFYNAKDLRLVDYKFMRRGDPILFSNPTKSFQALDSTFPAFRRFYEAHYLHHFNGAILNKIPLLKKLNLMEVAGGGILYLPERKLKYAEAFIGLEKVLRISTERFKLGIYMVGSVANQFNNPIQFKIGIEHFNKRRNSFY